MYTFFFESAYSQINNFLKRISTQCRILTLLRYITLENIVRKGEIACNKQFLLFSQCFLPYMTLIFHFKCSLKCRLQFVSIWTGLKFLPPGNGLIICQVLSLDTAACTYLNIANCNHDNECVWCGDPPGSCTRIDTCAAPMKVDELVSALVLNLRKFTSSSHQRWLVGLYGQR